MSRWPFGCRDINECEYRRICIAPGCRHAGNAHLGDAIDASVAALNQSYANYRRFKEEAELKDEIKAEREAKPALPHAVWSGKLEVFGVELNCHVLSNGQRVVDEESMVRLLRRMEGSDNATLDPDALKKFALWMRGQ